MKKVAVTGLSGVLGSYLTPSLCRYHNVVDLFNSNPSPHQDISLHQNCNLLNKQSVSDALSATQPDCILHLAAQTHIDYCEQDKQNGESGVVWRTNVVGTSWIAEWAATNNKHLILLSTESVFDGAQTSYAENSQTNPVSWYGITKNAAEQTVLNSPAKTSIVRAVTIYNTDASPKTFFGLFLRQLSTSQPFKAVSDHLLTPTYIPDLWRCLSGIINQECTGIYHATPREAVTPFEMTQKIAQTYSLDGSVVSPVTLLAFLGEDRARLRVKNACLSSEVTQQKLGISFTNLDQALAKI